MTMRNVLLGSLFCLAFAGSANATLIATVSPTGAPAGQTYATLNTLPLGNAGGMTATGINVTFAGTAAMVVTGTSGTTYAAPVFSNGNGAAFGDANGVDTTRYIEVGASNPASSATLSFGTAEQFVGLLWGSVDPYNTLTFFSGANGTGTAVGSLTGANLPSSGDNGNRTATGTVYVNVNSTLAFQSLVVTSTQNAFELDDVAFGPAQVSVPEPVSLALLGSGLIGLAAVRRRKS